MTSIPLHIHRIPPEILCETFAHCSPSLAYQSAPQILSSVCRSWRALVLATPALWASLDIACNNDILRPPLPVIHTYLQRSQTHPLSFTLCSDDSKYDFDTNPNILPVLKALAATRRRWRNVDIKLIRMTQDILDFIMLGDAPLLESIRYHCPRNHFQTLPIPLRMLDHCPRLESFQWHSVGSPLSCLLSTHCSFSVTLFALTISECVLSCVSPRVYPVPSSTISPL
ncbi:hypothetical protein BD779DRAFT_1144577 [Infundibulicybe gibba]|nr:hypothetical protein BD779DRAFT_1144577 [Infundibulicybe gibba]